MPFMSTGGKWQVSTAGGEQPRWARNGKEIYYLAGNTLMAVEVVIRDTTFRLGAARPLFEIRRRTGGYRSFGVGSVYDVSGDGERFLFNLVREEPATASPITVITNWTATLR